MAAGVWLDPSARWLIRVRAALTVPKIVLKWKREAATAATVAHARQMLRLVLEDRFAPLPETLVKQIESIEDVNRLDAATLRVRKIERLEELNL